MIRIGSEKITTNIFLAPLAGCADLAFRLIARENGAKFCFFEMVDSNSLEYGPPRKMSILKTVEEDAPIAAQILGEDPAVMLRGARKILERVKIPFLDINAACPARKVIKKHSGSYLLREQANLAAIIKKLASSLPVPVTVKIRLGYDTCTPEGIVSLAKKCQSSGASAVFVHGRTSLQGYLGEVNYEYIRRIKDALRIPVFGIGNIFSCQLAEKMFKLTNCDGIMVARGCLGNPWIFKVIDEYLGKGKIPKPVSPAEKRVVLKRHLEYVNVYNECHPDSKLGVMRKTVMWYLRGFPGAARIRQQICVVKNYEKMLELIDEVIR